MDFLRTCLGVRGLDGERGQTMVEYALVLALVAVFVLVAVTQLGEAIGGVFETIRDEIAAV